MWPLKKQPRDDSYKAINEAKDHLEIVESREEEVQEVVELFKIMKQQNHFAEQFRNALGGPPDEPRSP